MRSVFRPHGHGLTLIHVVLTVQVISQAGFAVTGTVDCTCDEATVNLLHSWMPTGRAAQSTETENTKTQQREKHYEVVEADIWRETITKNHRGNYHKSF